MADFQGPHLPERSLVTPTKRGRGRLALCVGGQAKAMAAKPVSGLSPATKKPNTGQHRRGRPVPASTGTHCGTDQILTILTGVSTCQYPWWAILTNTGHCSVCVSMGADAGRYCPNLASTSQFENISSCLGAVLALLWGPIR